MSDPRLMLALTVPSSWSSSSQAAAHRHRPMTAADRVLVVERGAVVEDGSPSDLIAPEGGRCAGLHDAWLESLA